MVDHGWPPIVPEILWVSHSSHENSTEPLGTARAVVQIRHVGGAGETVTSGVSKA